MRPFEPLFKNAHLATIAGNYWSRPRSERRWPVEAVTYTTEPGVRVLVHTQRPQQEPRAHLVLIHGLEGSSDAGYARSMAHHALTRGWATHRFNMRGCGGTDDLSVTAYHAGQTSDVLSVIRELKTASKAPIYVIGYSLGGNVALKLAGELGEVGRDLIAGVCSVSAPIDLAACAQALGLKENRIYQDRFLARLKDRIRRRNRLYPALYNLDHLPKVRSIIDFDNLYTAQLFGFGNAANYFATQSANHFLHRIRVPALLIQAKDDPLIPFRVYDHPAFARNACLKLLAVEHGGHLGFLARNKPRFWVDQIVLDWMERPRDNEA